MTFVLDTNICMYLLKERAPEAMLIASRFNARECALSVITEFELRYGSVKGQRNAKYQMQLAAFLNALEILPLVSADVVTAATQRASLETTGLSIGPYDLLIAAQALSRGLTVVTNNEREFRRVRGLRVENWSRH